jgi:hypothetical protein
MVARFWLMLATGAATSCTAARSNPGHPSYTDGAASTARTNDPAAPIPDDADSQGVVERPAEGDAVRLAAPGAESAKRGARSQLELLRAMPADVLERIAQGGKPDERGAVGHNRGGWMGAQYQRSAALYFVVAVAKNDRAAAEDAWRAFDFAFAHQEDDGGFGSRNESGSPAADKDLYSDAAFWLAQVCQALLVVDASQMADGFAARVESIKPKVRRAASFLSRGKEVLAAREASATNRYFIDALAYGLSGVLLQDRNLVETGAFFVNLGLKKQHIDGFFEEAQGADSSYNCVSILMLEVHELYVEHAPAEAALAKALRWELAHVAADGAIDVAGNSRTGLGQERYFGKAKAINYPEAILALLYYGAKHHDDAVLDAARRVHGHALRSK